MAVVLLLPGTSLEDLVAAVRAELAPELARLDVDVSSRATAADVQQSTSQPAVYGGTLT